MDIFLKDLKIFEEKSKENKNLSRFIIEGLYPGYGITLGNALRRILISSIEGAAITSFKIKDVQHEFSTIPYVYQSVIDIMLNLKELHVRLYSDEPQTIKLKASGEREVYGRDFEPNPMVEIMNPDHLIATLTDKKANFELEATVEKGLGYSLAEDRKKGKTPIGTILMDAIFSPIEKVNFQVEDMRVGEKTNYNRLILDIETDGSVTPKEAFLKAVEILKGHLNFIEQNIKGEEKEMGLESSPAFKDIKREPKDILIEELDLSARTKNILLKHGIKTLAGLLRYKEESLKKLEGMGEKSLEEIKKVLKNLEYVIK
jgi:DNA-directed RNA polymerase subunit alpha